MDLAQVRELLTQIQGSARVSTAIGEPMQVGDRIVIPAAKISYCGGGGGGGGKGPETMPVEGSGGGGGAGVRVRPLGCWIIGPDGERWVPALDVNRLVMISGAVVFCLLWMLRKMLRRR